MAKGSGGVGKSAGKASVGGGAAAKAPAKTLATASLAEFGAAVTAQAKTLPKERGLVPISQVYGTMAERTGMTLPEFKARLVEAFRADKVDLARQELLTEYSPARMKSSEVKIGSQSFFFVDTRGGGFA